MYTLEELLKAIISSSPIAYVLSDEFGKIKFINEKVKNLTGWQVEELVNRDINNLVIFKEALKHNSNHDVEPEPIAVQVVCKDGKKIIIPAQVVEVKDLLKRNKFEGYLMKLQPDKQHGVVDKAQIEFVSTVSHELRTPLTSIKGFAETLLRSYDRLADDVKKKYVTIIKEQSERLTRLVEDLLAVSRLESNRYKLTLRAINAEVLINKVCESLGAKASNHKIKIEAENKLPDIKADPDKLEQILTNLLDNAIKYSPSGSVVTIALSSVCGNNGVKEKVKIDISDQGMGIQENDLPKIFTKFGRLDNPMTRQAQGTGLGLFITKSLVLALKGEIFVKSKPGETIFTVILPAEIPSEAIPLSSGEVKAEK